MGEIFLYSYLKKPLMDRDLYIYGPKNILMAALMRF